MRRVLRGYAKDRDGNLILLGTMPAPHSKYKASPRERQDKRDLIRQGANNLPEGNCPLVSPRVALLLIHLKNLAEAETDNRSRDHC